MSLTTKYTGTTYCELARCYIKVESNFPKDRSGQANFEFSKCYFQWTYPHCKTELQKHIRSCIMRCAGANWTWLVLYLSRDFFLSNIFIIMNFLSLLGGFEMLVEELLSVTETSAAEEPMLFTQEAAAYILASAAPYYATGMVTFLM